MSKSRPKPPANPPPKSAKELAADAARAAAGGAPPKKDRLAAIAAQAVEEGGSVTAPAPTPAPAAGKGGKKTSEKPGAAEKKPGGAKKKPGAAKKRSENPPADDTVESNVDGTDTSDVMGDTPDTESLGEVKINTAPKSPPKEPFFKPVTGPAGAVGGAAKTLARNIPNLLWNTATIGGGLSAAGVGLGVGAKGLGWGIKQLRDEIYGKPLPPGQQQQQPDSSDSGEVSAGRRFQQAVKAARIRDGRAPAPNSGSSIIRSLQTRKYS